MDSGKNGIQKILLYSPVFYPSVGGLEAVAAMIAEGLTDLGCSVRVVTGTPGCGDDARFPYAIIRLPSALGLLSHVRWCDVFFQQNISLKGLWPLVVYRRRFVVAHHGLYAPADGRKAWQARLKLLVARFAENIAVSAFVARALGGAVPCTVIPNPYREDVFRLLPDVPRDLDLVFAGRLVSDKGAGHLIDALGLLRTGGLTPRLTIIGEGPEEAALLQRASASGVSGQVTFLGRKSANELPALLNRHQLLIVPSIVKEGFGVVALEGIACGCGVIASDAGGLPEAVGPCGMLFPTGDRDALAGCIAGLLGDPERLASMRRAAPDHLAAHTRQRVAAAYLEALQNTTGMP